MNYYPAGGLPAGYAAIPAAEKPGLLAPSPYAASLQPSPYAPQPGMMQAPGFPRQPYAVVSQATLAYSPAAQQAAAAYYTSAAGYSPANVPLS